jgi:PAS domain S-box-containing protein
MLTRKVRGKEIIDYDGTVVFLPNASGQLLGPDGHPFTDPDFRSRARKTPAIMFESDDAGNIWHNAFTAQFTNIPRESLLGMDFLRVVHPEDRFTYLAQYVSALTERRPMRKDVRVLRGDGRARLMRAIVYPVGDSRMVGGCIDIGDVTSPCAVERRHPRDGRR